MSDLAAGTRTGTLHLMASFPIIQFYYALFKPRVRIDGGEESQISWGDNSLQLPEGEHEIAVRTKWYGFISVGKATTMVSVSAGGTVGLNYRAPWFTLFFPGKLTQV
ncbi:MAG: hypothetical protein ACR2HR_05175 [Euzebya sp.]